MNKKLNILFFCVLLSTLSCLAQNTLNLHRKNGGVVSYGFSEKPVVTYENEILHVSTTMVSIDYPLSELEKMTFSDVESAIGVLTIEDNDTEIFIYRMDGTLVKRIESGVLTLELSDLPNGTYVIKQGTITTKITKR